MGVLPNLFNLFLDSGDSRVDCLLVWHISLINNNPENVSDYPKYTLFCLLLQY